MQFDIRMNDWLLPDSFIFKNTLGTLWLDISHW